MCMSIETTGVLKKPSSTEKARIDWCHWSDRRLSDRRIELKRLIHFCETKKRTRYSALKQQRTEDELERINEVIETRRQANNEIKRQMLESELEVLTPRSGPRTHRHHRRAHHRQAHIVH